MCNLHMFMETQKWNSNHFGEQFMYMHTYTDAKMKVDYNNMHIKVHATCMYTFGYSVKEMF